GTAEGLPSNTVESLQKDRYNTVWIGMTNGICRLNFEKRIISYYDRRDGIMYDKFQQAGVQQVEDRRIFFFTDHNFMAFDPQKVSPKELPPQPFITSFKLGGEPLSTDSLHALKNVVLRYTNTSFSIDFSAMSFLQQRKLHYYYMLEGQDKDWIHTDRPTAATYNYLPPGDYTFYVKTETADGLSSPTMARLDIKVQAPFWKTPWFYVLIALVLAGIWYLIDKERIKRRRLLLQVRNEIAHSLHDDISLTLSDINVLSEIAKIKAGKNIEQSKDFIAKISEKSSNMITAMDDMLWSIDPANDSMKKTLDRIKEFTYGLQATYGAEIELMVDKKLEKQELEMKLRHDFFFLYNDAISFLVKQAYTSAIFVNMKLRKTGMLIEIITECPEDVLYFETQFRKIVQRRLQQLPGSMNFTIDNNYVLAVFNIQLK
ncbi:MAG: triple tyrosine motif-containing protein, partial [Chitinophagaceae bacterium]